MYAISNLDGILFLITSQLKVVTTAYFSWLMKGTRINLVQKSALVLLTLGTTIVQLSSISSPNNGEHEGNGILGLLAVILATISSGFAGIFFECSLHSKNSQEEKDDELPIIWLLNIYLAVSGMFFSAVLMLIFDGPILREKGLFHGYNVFTFLLAVLMALCGFIIAYIVKYADSIIKGFASALCIVTSGIIMDSLSPNPGNSLTLDKLLGGSMVVSSILMYSYPLRVEKFFALSVNPILSLYHQAFNTSNKI